MASREIMWSMPECYNPAHNHASPEESTEKQSEIYRVSYEAMEANDPNVFNLLCNCGTPQDYYSLPYMTQIATADPTSVDQTRRRVKAYKALMGDYFPVTADHNNIWYPSAVGTGSVLIEKRDLSGTAKEEYENGLGLRIQFSCRKAGLLAIFTVMVLTLTKPMWWRKTGVMYYAFYKDGSKYSPTGYPDIELKG